MRKKINQLAAGELDEKKAKIELPVLPVTESVTCGSVFTGELILRSENGVSFRGLAYSDDEHIELIQDGFAGASASIGYRIHAEDIEENTILEGNLTLVTNSGEILLPYHFSIRRPILLDENAPSTLNDMGRLAEQKPEVALNLFESEQFIHLPFLKDDSLRALYIALRRQPDRRLALEEFLTACGAKAEVRVRIEADPRTYVIEENALRGELLLKREGSGYHVITVKSEAPFIRLPKERWTALDFDGDSLSIPLHFRPELMHMGKNLGSLMINTGREEQRLSLTLIKNQNPDEEEKKRSQYRRLNLELCKGMVRLYASQQPPYNIESQVLKYLDAGDAIIPPDEERRLLRAEIYRQMNRREEEKETLEQIRASVQRQRADNVTQYLWFLYLEEEMEKGDRLSDAFLRLLYRLKDEEAGRPELLPLLMRSDSEWAEQPERCFQQIREHFLRGRVPLMLRIEAVILLNRHPELLTRLEPFTRKLLLFGARFECWSREVTERAAFLMREDRGFHPGKERAICLMEKAFPEREMLTSLLTVLMQRGAPLAAYRSWYEKGIQEDIQLTELYEYYLATAPAGSDEEIPQIVQLFYTYNSPSLLPAKRHLYRYILTRFGPETQMYRRYEKQIQSFAFEQLVRGTVGEEEAFFCEKMLIPEVLEPKTAALMADLIYTVHLRLANRSIETVLVFYGELKEPFAYPVRDGEAYIPLFSPRCRLLFVDQNGNRYTKTSFTRKKLMQADEKLVSRIRAYSPESMPFKLALCEKAVSGEIDEESLHRLAAAYESWTELSGEYREKLIYSMVRRPELSEAENSALLKALKNSPYLDSKAGQLLAEDFLSRGEDEAAVEMVHRFGYRNFDRDMLLRLMNRLIRKHGYGEEKNLFGVSLSLYRGGYWNPTTLTYLCRYFNGPSREMMTLLEKAAESEEAVFYDLPERLLGQMLFTGGTDRIEWVVAQYLSPRGTRRPNAVLLRAYAVERCEKYFCRNMPIADNIFNFLLSWAEAEKRPEKLPLICQIALTRRYAERESLSAEETALARTLLYHLYDEGKFFSYQKELGRFFTLPAELADKTLIEFRGDGEEALNLRYRILPQDEAAEARVVEMPHIFRGIFVKPLLLFADETLEYRIESKDGERILMEDRVQKSFTAGNNRFARLNKLISDALEEKENWQEEICEFGKRDSLLHEYFHVN